MAHTIFISYASGDEYYVEKIYNTLERIDYIEPLVIEWAQAAGIGLDTKVKTALNKSRCVIALVTQNSVNSQWLNQEIGYAVAKGLPIIPIKEESVIIKGFLEGKEYIRLSQHNFEVNLHQVITRLRDIFSQPLVLDVQLTRLKVHCQNCNNRFVIDLPSKAQVSSAIRDGQKFVQICNKCKATLYINPLDFSLSEWRIP